MIDIQRESLIPAQIRAIREKLNYQPNITRRSIGSYFVDEPTVTYLKEKGVIDNYLDGKNIIETDVKKEEKKAKKKNFLRKKTETRKRGPDEEGQNQITFINLIRHYHERSVKNGQGQFIDPLSMGILYALNSDRVESLRPSNISSLVELESFKTAKQTTLLSIAEGILNRFDDKNNTDEIDMFAKFIKSRTTYDLPISNSGWRDLFIDYLQNNPQEIIQEYLVDFRFIEEIENSENIFKLGRMAGETVKERDVQAKGRRNEAKNFLTYLEKEHKFLERYWGEKMEEGFKDREVSTNLKEAFHKKEQPNHRSKQALLDRGVIIQDKDVSKSNSEFIKIFKDLYSKDSEGKQRQNQMVLGMLYSMRHELGVGSLSQDEVRERTSELIPGLRTIGNDLVTNFLINNLDEFKSEILEELVDQFKKNNLSNHILSDNNSGKDLSAIISRNRSEIVKMLVNNSSVDGFKIGEILGDILRKTAGEKTTQDKENLSNLDTKIGDENISMKLLIEGRDLKDQAIYDRVERTMNITSRLKKFIDLTRNLTPSKALTRLKIAAQNKLFYSDGENPFIAPPSVKTETLSLGEAAIETAALGHAVNFLFEDPVNRGAQAIFFMARYFTNKEGGEMIKQFRERKKQLGLEKPKPKVPFLKLSKEEKKAYRGELKAYKKELKKYLKPIKKEIWGRFWHNKGKLLYSTLSYAVTSIGVNAVLQYFGISGPEAWAVLMASNTLVSGTMSGMGIRIGAEFIVNFFNRKKAVDQGMEILIGMDHYTGEAKLELMPKKPNKAVEFIKRRGKAVATSIASRIENSRMMRASKSKEASENKHLDMLRNFIEKKNSPDYKIDKDTLVELNDFLTWMKEEEAILLIHNPRFYSLRKIRQKDGSYLEVDNRKGLENIDKTRKEIVEYAQNNLSKEEYDEVYESSLDFFADVKNIREKVFNRRMKYMLYSYGYRAIFMSLSHILTENKGLLEDPVNTIFGNSTMDHQHVIAMDPTHVFQANIDSPQGKEDLAKEVWARTEELNNLANLLQTSEQMAEMQPGLESHLAYYGVTQSQMESFVDNLNENNLNTADLMRIVHILSSYQEGQEFLASIPGFDGTERRNLAPLVEYLTRKNPYEFINDAINGNKEKNIKEVPGLKTFLSLKYPDLAEKLEITSDSLDDQVNSLVIPDSDHPKGDSAVNDLLSKEPIVVTKLGPKVVKIGDVVSEFVDGVSEKEKQSRTDFLIQLNEILKSDNPHLQEALDSHYSSFLADANQHVDIEGSQVINEKLINRLPSDSIVFKIYQAIDPQTKEDSARILDLLNRAKSGDVKSYSALYQIVAGSKDSTYMVSQISESSENHVNIRSINLLPEESAILKIYKEIWSGSKDENIEVIKLINKVIDGDSSATNELLKILVEKDRIKVDQVFEANNNIDIQIYDKILSDLPADPNQKQDEIIRRLKDKLLNLGLRPVSAPIVNLEELTDLSQNPDIFVNPHQALIKALSPDNSDLEMAVSLAANNRRMFVIQNGIPVGSYQNSVQIPGEYTDEDLGILNAIEGSEQDNGRLTLPTIAWRNLGYVFGWSETMSGATTPAGSLVEMMTGPFGSESMNIDAPSTLHNYDAYSPGYLAKLIVAHFRDRVPEEMLKQMGPDADTLQKIYDKDPSVIERLCNKFEALIAAKVLVEKHGEDKVHEVYLNHVNMFTVDGVKIRGVEAASEVLFDKPFNELSSGEKFLVVSLGQSPEGYLFDYKYDDSGNIIEKVPNPEKAIRHAIYIIEEGKIGNKLDKFFGDISEKEKILRDLKLMEIKAKNDGWDKVFEGKIQLTEEMGNYAVTPDAVEIQGMTDEQIKEAINKGIIKSVTVANDGTKIIVLNDLVVLGSDKVMPEELLSTETVLNYQQVLQTQLAVYYSALTTDMKLNNDFYTTNSGAEIPAWWTVFKDPITGQTVETVTPGMAIVEIGPDGSMALVDPTNTLSSGPQLFGSAFKPLIIYSVLKLHPELNLGEQDFNSISKYYQEQLISNSTHIVDSQGTLDLRHALAASANVPIVDMWTKLSSQDPQLWEKFQQLAKDEFGIHFYELNKNGEYVEITKDPFIGNAAMPIGNIFVGGDKPESSGMVQMAEFYQKLGEMSVMGDPHASYVTDALGNDRYKQDVDVFGLDRKYFKGTWTKTGSQQGFDPKTGQPIAIRNVVAMVKIGEDGQIRTTFVITGGIKQDGSPTELGWGSDLLPVARSIADSSGNSFSSDSAEFALNQLLTTPEMSQDYKLGAVNIDQIYPLLKSISSEKQYAYLREAIRTEGKQYLFVDLVGAPVDDIQPIAIHLIDKDGVDRLITVNISADLINSIGENIDTFAGGESQNKIYGILEEAIKSEPEKYGGILNQFKSQGVNFVPISHYEGSPVLFSIRKQMIENGMLFSGAEDNGMVMEVLGLDPKTTVFVNDELLRAMNEQNPQAIKELLFAQREYLTVFSIYENSGYPGSLDSLLYEKDGSSSSSYQLLRIFIDTKTSQVFTPTDKEKQFLITQFQALMNNPEKANKYARDVFNAYSLYNQMSEQIARGEAPTNDQSKAFIDAMNNFTKTTDERTLLMFGIENQSVNEETITQTLPVEQVIDTTQTVSNEKITDPYMIIKEFFEKPKNFPMLSSERIRAEKLITAAQLITETITKNSDKNPEELKNILIENIENKFNMEATPELERLISQFVHGRIIEGERQRQCVNSFVVINRILFDQEVRGFPNFEPLGKGSAVSFISPLIKSIKDHQLGQSDFIGLHETSGPLYMEAVNEITKFKPGDSIVIYLPWMGESEVDNPGHVVQVLFSGKHPDGSPYLMIYDTNGDEKGTTAIRIIDSLDDFISQEAWETLKEIYPNPDIVNMPEPIFALVRPKE